ncbi:hypothetical protein HA466_0206060 [Hirschfeldia incana]|nr:hypothetical protein HA466_0206060 [Hirschfeldia incana]
MDGKFKALFVSKISFKTPRTSDRDVAAPRAYGTCLKQEPPAFRNSLHDRAPRLRGTCSKQEAAFRSSDQHVDLAAAPTHIKEPVSNKSPAFRKHSPWRLFAVLRAERERAAILLAQVCVCVLWFVEVVGGMSSMSRSRSRSPSRDRSRSRSPRDRRMRSERTSYRDPPYRRGDREPRRAFSQTNLCNNCKRPGHFARDCPNVSVCNNCGLPGHIAAECTAESRCWNCREPGHVASNCSNEGICHSCGKTGHRARDCSNPVSRAGDLRLCNNCFKPGHLAADCTNDKACKNCRTTGHIARDCQNDPVCNICSISGHVARNCPKGDSSYSDRDRDRDRGSRVRGGGMQRDGFGRMGRDSGMQRDGLSRGGRDGGGVGAMIICHNCGGRGHMAYECPSARIADRGSRRY